MKLNSALPPEAITAAVDELNPRPFGYESGSGEPRGVSVVERLKEGIPVSVVDTGDSTPLPGRGGESTRQQADETRSAIG
jgi:hypothetical protein